MAQRRLSRTRLPINYPSIPDSQSKPGRHDEPAQTGKPDSVPATRFQLTPGRSKADLRLRVEQLLLRRDAARVEDWAELGEPGRALLVEMLDDDAVRSHDALFHRAISVIGQLAVKRSIVPLAAILASDSESSLTKAYAATALGYIGDPVAVEALARTLSARDDMVRRQVAKALGRLDHPSVIPHLLKLQGDKAASVSEVAAEALQRWEKKLDQRLGALRKASERKPSRKKIQPAPDR